MEEKDLVSKIVLLKDIKPKEYWVVSCRSRLAFRIEMERKKALLNKDIFALEELFSFWRVFNFNRTFKTLYISAILFALLVCSGGVTVFAAMKSLPGSSLYPVKLAVEKARTLVASSQESKIKLQSELTNTRLQELKQIVEAPDSLGQKTAQVDQVVGQIQQQLATFKDQLPQAKDNGSQKSVETAKMVGEKVSQIEKALVQAQKSLNSDSGQNLNNKISEATAAADKTSDQALEIIVNNKSQASPADKQAALAKIEENINNARIEEKMIKEKISLIGIKASSGVEAILVIDKSVVDDQLKKASDLLDKAANSLKQQDAQTAFKLLGAAKEILKSAENLTEISAQGQIDSQNGDSNLNKTATSSEVTK